MRRERRGGEMGQSAVGWGRKEPPGGGESPQIGVGKGEFGGEDWVREMRGGGERKEGEMERGEKEERETIGKEYEEEEEKKNGAKMERVQGEKEREGGKKEMNVREEEEEGRKEGEK